MKNLFILYTLFFTGCSISPLYNHSFESNVLSSNNNNIVVNVIPGRDGQTLRLKLIDMLRDMDFVNEKHTLSVDLDWKEETFAISEDGNAKRVRFIYNAKIILENSEKDKLLEQSIFVSTSYNISHSHGEVSLSLYGRHNDSLLNELSSRIVEKIKICLHE